MQDLTTNKISQTTQYVIVVGLLFLPLIYPGIWQTSSDLLPKRVGLYALGLILSCLWFFSKQSLQATPLTLAATAYVLINLLSLFWSTNPFTGFVEAIQLIVLFIIFLIITTCNKPSHITTWAFAATTGGFIVALIGILQYLGFAFTHMLSVGMPSSTFIFRNFAATYMIAIWPLSLFAYITDPMASRRTFWMIASTTILLFIAYTRTRGAWLGLLISGLVGFLLIVYHPSLRQDLIQRFTTHNKIALVICLLLLGVGMTLSSQTPTGVVQRFDEQKTTALQTATSTLSAGGDRGRLLMWQHSLSMIIDNPILGVGLDNWEYHYPRYDKGDKITEHSEPVRPHNDFIWIASELGLIGLLSFLLLLGIAVQTGIRLYLSSNIEHQWIALIACMGLIAWLVHSLFSFPKEQPISAFLFWIHLALLGICTATPTQQKMPKQVLACIGILICCGGLYLNQRHIHFDKYFHWAQSHANNQQAQAALYNISQALNQGPFDHRAQFLLGRYHQLSQQYPQAIEAYQKALTQHPHYAHTHHNLGGIYAAQKQWSNATAYYQKAIEIRPSYYQARINLGRAYLEQGQFQNAIQSFNNALKNNLNSATAWLMLGATYLQNNDHPNAIQALTKSVALNPKNVQALNNLALSYEQSGNIPKAIETYKTLLQHWQGDSAYRNNIIQHIQTLTLETP